MSYVLIADDDDNCRKLLKMALQPLGCDVGVATNGLEAVAMAHQRKPDLVMLDVMMPEADGFTACRMIRQIKGCETVPIMALTSLDDQFGASDAGNAGFDLLMWKPWQVPVLQAKVKAFLSLAEQAASSE